jgi:hypothetical protein
MARARGNALLVAALAACVAPSAGVQARDSRVTVLDSGSGLKLGARPANCRIEFLRTRPPEQPYDEVATLHVHGFAVNAARAQELLRAEACALGADAVFVVREYTDVLPMVATALSYREPRLQREAEAKRERQRLASLGAPEGFVPARVLASGTIRVSPDRRAPASGEVKAGESVWAVREEVRGHRRVRHADGRAGYVESRLLDVGGPGAPQQQPPAAVTTPGTSI